MKTKLNSNKSIPLYPEIDVISKVEMTESGTVLKEYMVFVVNNQAVAHKVVCPQ